ncbi:MAG: hypothetical protein KAT71_04825, partial [Gammaproteobacteria bacterium]|nr:hypothetical protein [Gammaproteobacteria bacterium]
LQYVLENRLHSESLRHIGRLILNKAIGLVASYIEHADWQMLARILSVTRGAILAEDIITLKTLVLGVDFAVEGDKKAYILAQATFSDIIAASPDSLQEFLGAAQAYIKEQEPNWHHATQYTMLFALAKNPLAFASSLHKHHKENFEQINAAVELLDAILADKTVSLAFKGMVYKLYVALNNYPNAQGIRLSSLQEEQHWQAAMNAIATMMPQEGSKPIAYISLGGSHRTVETVYLLPRVVENLYIGSKLKRKRDPGHGGTHVSLVDNFFKPTLRFKPDPESLNGYMFEELVNRLLGGKITSRSSVGILQDGDKRTAVEISEHIEAETLLDALRRHPEKLRQLDMRSFTQHLLRVLLTNPEDDDARDYYLEEFELPDGTIKYRLIRKDNNRGLFTAEHRGRLQVKSIILCLNQMTEELDQDVIEEFMEQQGNYYEIFEAWLKDAKQFNMLLCSKDMFSEDEFVEHLHRENPSLLALYILEDKARQLLDRYESLQMLFRLGKKERRAFFGIDLAEVLQPDLARHYEEQLKKISDDPTIALVRFNAAIPEGAYSAGVSSMSSRDAISASLQLTSGVSEKLAKQIRKGKVSSPTQALKELKRQIYWTNHRDAIARAVVAGRLEELQDLAKMSARSRRLIIRAIKKCHPQLSVSLQKGILRAMHGIPYRVLKLDQFADGLTASLLNNILIGAGKHLQKLSLCGHNLSAGLLTTDVFKTLAENCPNLTSLYISPDRCELIMHVEVDKYAIECWLRRNRNTSNILLVRKEASDGSCKYAIYGKISKWVFVEDREIAASSVLYKTLVAFYNGSRDIKINETDILVLSKQYLGRRHEYFKEIKVEEVFPKLKIFFVEGCSELTTVAIKAPALTKLSIKNCPRLLSLDVSSRELTEIEIKYSYMLQPECLGELTACPEKLRYVVLEVCQLIDPQRCKFYREFPYLLGILPSFWLPSTVAKLDQSIRDTLHLYLLHKDTLPGKMRQLLRGYIEYIVAIHKDIFCNKEMLFKDDKFVDLLVNSGIDPLIIYYNALENRLQRAKVLARADMLEYVLQHAHDERCQWFEHLICYELSEHPMHLSILKFFLQTSNSFWKKITIIDFLPNLKNQDGAAVIEILLPMLANPIFAIKYRVAVALSHTQYKIDGDIRGVLNC